MKKYKKVFFCRVKWTFVPLRDECESELMLKFFSALISLSAVCETEANTRYYSIEGLFVLQRCE